MAAGQADGRAGCPEVKALFQSVQSLLMKVFCWIEKTSKPFCGMVLCQLVICLPQPCSGLTASRMLIGATLARELCP